MAWRGWSEDARNENVGGHFQAFCPEIRQEVGARKVKGEKIRGSGGQEVGYGYSSFLRSLFGINWRG